MKALHHIEFWVSDLEQESASWGWVLELLGWTVDQNWEGGVSWRAVDVYIVLTTAPALTGDAHDRRRPGVNHLALWAPSRAAVDAITATAPNHGWQALYSDRYPHAGGPEHYAAYL